MNGTNSAPIKLHDLLKSMGGKDIAKMPQDWRESYIQDTAAKFCNACEPLHELVLGDQAKDRKWLWQCEPASNYDSEWVASYSMVKVDHLGAMAGESMKVQMAVAMYPGMKLTVDLLAEYHDSRGGGLQARPRIKIGVAASGDPELMIAESYLAAVTGDFPMGMNGILLQVVPVARCCDEIKNPPDIHAAFKNAVESARLANDEQSAESSITETVYVEMVVDQSASVMNMHRALIAMGTFFTSASNALHYV